LSRKRADISSIKYAVLLCAHDEDLTSQVFGKRSAFTGATANGISTSNFGPWNGSFMLYDRATDINTGIFLAATDLAFLLML
jgi:hypothetical protein